MILQAMLAAALLAGGSETAANGPVSATLRWGEGTTNATLTITRGGDELFSRAIPGAVCDGCVLAGDGDVAVTDLDGDGENEVVVTSTTGGTQCCDLSGVYDFRGGTYGELTRNWGFAGLNLTDVDGDGRLEFRSTDDRFLKDFTTHAAAWPPPRVWRYLHQDGVPVMVDVTGAYGTLIRSNAAEAKRRLRGAAGSDRRGYAATYVADEYLLGRGATGLRELERRKLGRSFRTSLLKRLHRYGYR
jgi:VCBS repeat protein